MRSLWSRRSFTMTGSVALMGAAIRPASAQMVDPRPPTVAIPDAREIADCVWIVSDHRIWLVPNIGIILGRDAALVVDCGLGPANGERVMQLARKFAGPRRLMLTLTHFHPEHGYGAQVFRPDATIIYNRAQLAAKGVRYIDLFRRRQSPAAAAALEGTQTVMPHLVYDGPWAEIDLGGRTVELHNWGLAHTRGDQVVFLPRERILFAGDLIDERMFPIFPWFPPTDMEVDAINWANVLNGFQRFDPALIVPGHVDPGDIAIALNLASHIETVGRDVRAQRKAGKSADDIVRDYKPAVVVAEPKWEHSFLIDGELRCFAAQAA